jgi:hypothetical protein
MSNRMWWNNPWKARGVLRKEDGRIQNIANVHSGYHILRELGTPRERTFPKRKEFIRKCKRLLKAKRKLHVEN